MRSLNARLYKGAVGAEAIAGRRRSSRLKVFAQSLAAVAADPAVRFGIKLGLQGVLALYLALVLRLEHASWAVVTVILLAQAQYVGAIAQKSIARVAGTIAGGFVGVGLAGNYEQRPGLFLLLVFASVAVCMYMAGGTWFSYSFFLCAVTLASVCGYGISEPADVWQVGLSRTLEVLVGVAAVIAGNVLWPRYARDDFLRLTGEALADAGELVRLQREGLERETDLRDAAQLVTSSARQAVTKLQALLQVAARESLPFRRRLPSYRRAVVSLSHLLEACSDLFRHYQARPRYIDHFSANLFALHHAMEREVSLLVEATLSTRPCADESGLQQSFETFTRHLQEGLAAGLLNAWTMDELLDLATHYQALRGICDELSDLRTQLTALPRAWYRPFRVEPHRFEIPKISWERLREAVKCALAVTGALVFCDWLRPPGAAGVPVFALAVLFLSKSFPGGRGGRGLLQGAFQVSIAGLIFVVVMYGLTPAMADYGVMSLVLFVELFIVGCHAASAGGTSLPQLAALLFVASTVGLNAQQPVPPEAVWQAYFGLTLPVIVAAIVGRLVWPVLPEAEVRQRFVEFFLLVGSLLSMAPGEADAALTDHLALLPVAATNWVQGLRSSRCPESEVAKILTLTESMRALALHVIRRARKEWSPQPPAISELVNPPGERLRTRFRETSEALANVFAQGCTRLQVPEAEPELASFRAVFEQVCRADLLTGQSLDTLTGYFSLVHRLDAIADNLERCRRQTLELRLDEYWGDYVL